MRTQQKARTRQAIVRAASALLERGRRPSLDVIAQEAQVSRATAYRYFPRLDALLSEAAGELVSAEAGALFATQGPGDSFERLALIDESLDKACREREVLSRLMLARALQGSAGDAPPRDRRRVPLLEQALAPLEPRLGRARTTRLARALAMVVGTEGFLALNDVVGLDEDESREVRRWAIDALVAAALGEAYSAQ
jgi:AcrR family transcriptional regulator